MAKVVRGSGSSREKNVWEVTFCADVQAMLKYEPQALKALITFTMAVPKVDAEAQQRAPHHLQQLPVPPQGHTGAFGV
jgi:hypothetical protein